MPLKTMCNGAQRYKTCNINATFLRSKMESHRNKVARPLLSRTVPLNFYSDIFVVCVSGYDNIMSAALKLWMMIGCDSGR